MFDLMFRKRCMRSSLVATSSTPNLLDGSLVTTALYSAGLGQLGAVELGAAYPSDGHV